MNNVNKLNLALSFVKQAGTPFGLLRSFLQKAKPLFHGVNPANQQGLLKMPKALTAYEAAARNLAKNTEGHGLQRTPLKKLVSTPVLNNKAFLNFEDVLKDTGYFSSMSPIGAAIKIAPLKYKGPVKDYASSLLSSNLNLGAGKNWSNISFAPRRPIWNYGNFGVMTTPSRVSGAPLMSSKSLLLGEEVMAGPLIKLKKSGIPEHFELPQATGKIYYKPSPDNADFARQLIKSYGRHNVIPLNSANLRKIDKITKGKPEYDYNVESGNLSRRELDDRFPDYDDHYERVKSWFKDMQTKYR